MTSPVETIRSAGSAGDEITVRPAGEGTSIIATRGSRFRRHAHRYGIYKDGEFEQLRD